MNAVQNKINPNRLTISIEHEGKTGEEYPEAQYQATLFLHKMLVSQFQIPVDRHHIIGHYQIDSVNRPQCPGRAFPWSRLMEDLQNMVNQNGSLHLNGFNIQFGFKGWFLKHGAVESPSDPAAGGIKLFGLPITNEYQQDGTTRQSFERYVMEYDPTAADDWKIRGAAVGKLWPVP